ncbi:MAG: transcriptional regulator [Dehalococcoidia bacterium]|nr:transcriptional regulator [Dehalococcoidia bacterium]
MAKSKTVQEQLTRRMAGEIVISERPGETLRKWREIFQLSQKELATLLEVNPSVVCDFEKGRRASPGIVTVRKFVEAMVDYDLSHGGKVVNTMVGTRNNEAIVDIREFTSGISIKTIIEKIDGDVLAGSEEIIERPIYGYTMVDSLKAITTFNAFGEMYGWSNERAVFFSGVHYGRSPMIAVRAHPVKPRMAVYVKPKAVDPLAPKLADMEKVVLVKTDLDESTIVERLRYLR